MTVNSTLCPALVWKNVLGDGGSYLKYRTLFDIDSCRMILIRKPAALALPINSALNID
jgi:hypothetical protein